MWTADPNGNDALPLEYKLEEGCAFRHLNIADVVNEPFGLRLFRSEERRPKEERIRFLGVNVCPVVDDLSD